jgi:hypothetical protein
MREVMLKENRGIYRRPEIRLFIEDGRSFVRHSDEKYQVLQATLVDTWASTAAGAFALSENNLYTSDAFYDYLAHLTDDGVLSFTRWGFDPPRESLRLVSLAMEALAKLGESDPASHVIAMREDTEKINGWGATDTVVISRKPFSAADLASARTLIAGSRMETLYLPGEAPHNAFGELLRSPDPQAFWRDYRYDISPVSDDRPFFFYNRPTARSVGLRQERERRHRRLQAQSGGPNAVRANCSEPRGDRADHGPAQDAARQPLAETERRPSRSCGISCAWEPATS